MPAAPRVFAELSRRLQDQGCSLGDVAELVKRDAALAARVLRVSNSAAYRGEQPTASVEDAVARIGYREVFQMIGLIAAEQWAGAELKSYGIEAADLRINTLKTALVCAELARECELDERAAYTAGLMRVIGLFVCDRLAQTREPVQVWHPAHDADYTRWEARLFGISNGDVAAIVLAEWSFPDDVVTAVRDHYLGPGAESTGALARVLNIASTLVHEDGEGFLGESAHWGLADEKLQALGVSRRAAKAARERALRLVSEKEALIKEWVQPHAEAHQPVPSVDDVRALLTRNASPPPASEKKCDFAPPVGVVEVNDDTPVHTPETRPAVTAPTDFTTFMRNYQDMVYSTAVRLVNNDAQAEDISQEVFIKAHQHWDSLSGSPTAGGWLKTVATNLSINHIQRYKKRWSFFSDLVHRSDEGEEKEVEFAAPDTFFDAMDATERRARLESALEKLPDHQRIPLVLFHFEEMPYEDIAKKLRISLSKVKTDILRGREALAKILVRRGTAHEAFQP